MFQIFYPFQDFFYLIPGISLDFCSKTIDKGLKNCQGFSKKHFKILPNDWDQTFSFELFFVLLSSKVDRILKKSHKQNSIKPNGFSNDKIVVALLTKVITFYVVPIIINIGGSSLKKLFSGFFHGYLSLKNCLNDLLKVLFYILGNVIYGSLRGSNREFNLKFIQRFI